MMRCLLRFFLVFAVLWLSGCASSPPLKDDGALQREAVAGTEQPAPKPLPLETSIQPEGGKLRQQIDNGSGRFIRPHALAIPYKPATDKGTVTLNFENQPIQAVVKTILGDLLQQNYAIMPGVQGSISFSTAKPVDKNQALSILGTLLGWTNNALVQQNGRYVVMPAKLAVAGNLVPGLGAAMPEYGLQARLFPLRYISATEMQKLIKPFAQPDAILLVDPSRNLLVMSGTAEELANYQRTINTFDVNWLRGMSVGVFALQRANVRELLPQLDKLFGPTSNTPLAGMLRFMPVERTNTLVVISTQADYLDEVGGWIAKIDGGGGSSEPELYVYNVRNLKAADLARYLAQIYTDGDKGDGGDQRGKVGPGLTPGSIGNASGMGSTAGSFGSAAGTTFGSNNNDLNNNSFGNNSTGGDLSGLGGGAAAATNPFGSTTDASTQAPQDRQYRSADGSIRISSVDANNQLLVRARPYQWEQIKAVIEKLDKVPLQVQIETRILEVSLTGDFRFGVQWYLGGLIGAKTDDKGNLVPGNDSHQGALGQGGPNYFPGSGNTPGDGLFYSFLGHHLQVALRALESSGNTKTLSEPSLVVLNNQTAHIQVGEQVPVNQSYITTAGSANSVEYRDTGVILNVQPRVNPGGLVYLTIQQQVSEPGTPDAKGNFTISQRQMNTQVAVQSGQTVMLGGLIQQADGDSKSGVPLLSRIPILGHLFGSTNRNRSRTELLLLITPKVITNSEDARQVTEEYQREFQSLAPLRAAAARAKPHK